MPTKNTFTFLEIPLTRIGGRLGTVSTLPRFRKHVDSPTELSALKASIEKFGLMRPPAVWAVPGSSSYAILDGDRRVAALRLIDPSASVTCAVFGGDVDSAREVSILAHLGMGGETELNHGDEIVGVLWLLTKKRFKRQQDLADAVNRKQGWVSQARMIRDRLSDAAFEALRDGTISRNTARKWASHGKDAKHGHDEQASALTGYVQPKRGRKPGTLAPWKSRSKSPEAGSSAS